MRSKYFLSHSDIAPHEPDEHNGNTSQAQVTSKYFCQSQPTTLTTKSSTKICPEKWDISYCLRTQPPGVNLLKDLDSEFCRTFRLYHVLYRHLAAVKPKLVQEIVGGNPWKVLVSACLLNKTSGSAAIPVFWTILEKWHTPVQLSTARCSELYAYLQPLGLQAIRTRRLKALSSAYIDDPPSPLRLFPSRVPNGYLGEQRYPPTPVSHLPGSGRYALDSYRIFCMDETNPELEEWKRVKPTDKELIRYLKWRWAWQERLIWDPISGDTRSAFPDDLISLVCELYENTSPTSSINLSSMNLAQLMEDGGFSSC